MGPLICVWQLQLVEGCVGSAQKQKVGLWSVLRATVRVSPDTPPTDYSYKSSKLSAVH
jgi:hypothetical protein